LGGGSPARCAALAEQYGFETARGLALFIELDVESFEEPCSARRCEAEGSAAGDSFEPSKLQKTTQYCGADQPFEVITTLGPVKAGLAEDPPATRPRTQIGTERA